MATTIRQPGNAPKSEYLLQPHQISLYAHSSADSLLAGFNSLGKSRGGGAPSHEQQDLLRAMLMFAGAGLDACAQQIVRDALPEVVKNHEDARNALQGFAARKLRKGPESDAGGVDARVLAGVLLKDPEREFISQLVEELTGSSMQSAEELKRVAIHVGVYGSARLTAAIEAVRGPLEVRNRIIHDMDVKFTENTVRNRRPRKRADMVENTNLLLACAEQMIKAVDEELS